MTRVMLAILGCAMAVCGVGFGMQAAKAPTWAAGAKVTESAVGNTPNATAFGTRVFFAGQPGEADLAAYAKLGVKKVINLRMPSEMAGVGFDEAAVARKDGMEYVHVPVTGQGPTDADMKKVFAALETAGDGKVLLHCASSNRAGLMWSLFRGSQHGLDTDDAVNEGKAAGMKSAALEKIARDKLAASGH